MLCLWNLNYNLNLKNLNLNHDLPKITLIQLMVSFLKSSLEKWLKLHFKSRLKTFLNFLFTVSVPLFTKTLL